MSVTFSASHSGEVSWDGGTIWTPFTAGNVTGTCTGPGKTAKIRSIDMTRIQFFNDDYKEIHITNGTSLTSAEAMCGDWAGMNNLLNFQFDGPNQITTLYGAFYSCTGLTSFPLMDTSTVEVFDYAWDSCSGLTSFPLIDMSGILPATSTCFSSSAVRNFACLKAISSGRTPEIAFSSAFSTACFSISAFIPCRLTIIALVATTSSAKPFPNPAFISVADLLIWAESPANACFAELA